MTEFKKIISPQALLDQEIARLYRLGQTHLPYSATITTEMMMMLYLTNKYNIENPHFTHIREQYRKYGRSSIRVREKYEKPVFCTWELALDFDEKDRLVKTNCDDYFSAFYWNLRRVIDENPGKKVFCPFNIAFYTNGEVTTGHIETVVYDPILNILEHFDSNNLPKQCARKDRGYFACCEISTSIVERVAEIMDEKPRYVGNTSIYSAYAWGIQSLEGASDKLTVEEKQGYCLVWSSLFTDLALSFPGISIKEIVDAMMRKARSGRNKAESLNDYFLFMIRGYVSDLSNTLDVNFADENSQHNACIQLSR